MQRAIHRTISHAAVSPPRSTQAIQAIAPLAILALIVLASPVVGQTASPDHADGPEHGPAVPLYADPGTHGRRITTTSIHAQAYFDQGLRLQYAFNHEVAIESYREALKSDPACAMC